MGMFDQSRGMFADTFGDPGALGKLVAEYLQNVGSGKIAAEGVLGQNHYDPNRSFAQNALDPRAIENAMDIALGLGTGPIRAYHGSPYDFNKFDLSKVGTGEGAQAYGHGLYFAEAEDVARAYRDSVKNMALIDANNKRMSQIAREMDAFRKPGTYREFSDPRGYELAAEYDRLMAEKMAPGKMYEVNIHADPDAFLNWDKPLSGQPHVQEAVTRLGIGDPSSSAISMTRGLSGWGDYSGQDMYARIAARFAKPVSEDVPGVPRGWGAVAGAVNDRPYNGAAASQGLLEHGIPGIKYLDQGSRGAGQGTSNYVVFDPSLIEILRKYGILGPIAAPGALIPFIDQQQ